MEFAKRQALRNNGQYQFDEYVLPVFELLAQYFSYDKKFEESCDNWGNNYNLNKGIYLFGDPGRGKTELFKCFQYNKRMCFYPITVDDIEKRIRERGFEYLSTYLGYVPQLGWTANYFYQSNSPGYLVNQPLLTSTLIRFAVRPNI